MKQQDEEKSSLENGKLTSADESEKQRYAQSVITPRSPSDPYARLEQTFPTLSDAQVQRALPYGTRCSLPQGEVLFKRGERTVDFFLVLEGDIEIFETTRKGVQVFTVHQKHGFTGELDLFSDRKILVSGRMGCDGEVLRVSRPQFRQLLSQEPDIAEIIIRAFILRRMGLITHTQGGVTMLCDGRDAASISLERFLRRNGYPIEILDCSSAEGEALRQESKIEHSELPALLLYHGAEPLKRPTLYQVADELGIRESVKSGDSYDVVVVGGGPSGLSAAVYAASEGLSALLIEKEAPGGQAGTSSRIENYLGFPTGISGQALAGRAQIQAQKFGAKISVPSSVTAIDCSGLPFVISLCDGQKVSARSVVVASGASYRRLNLPNSQRFDNAGVYYAATAMEGEMCQQKEIVVVGGGNSAGQAAVFLSQRAAKVHILVRGEGLVSSMSDYLIQRIHSSPKIELHTHSQIVELNGEDSLESLTWVDSRTDEKTSLDCNHLFLMIGAVPNTAWLKDCVKLDGSGFIITDGPNEGAEQGGRKRLMLESSVPGIFAVGDVRAGSVKRVASGVGEGSVVISQVHQHLSDLTFSS